MEPRRLSVDLVAAVQRGKLIDYLLDEGKLAVRYQGLEPRDRALTRAITGATLRRWGQIEDALARFLERPLPDDAGQLKAIMGVAAAQVLFMDIADHAAVALAVDLVAADRASAPFKGVANAVLRRVAAEKLAILADQDAVELNTPRWMQDRWTDAYGADTARAIAASHLVEPSLDLTVKSDPEGWAARLGGIVLPNGSVRVTGQGAVEKLEGYEEGQWWVQDAAATLPVRLLGDVADKKVADLCAAPGGKTAMLAHFGGKVTAVDVSYHRLARLKRNLTRLGLDADVLTADLKEWMGGPFDMILLDAPCTATGTLRRHPDGVLSKKPSDVASLAALQRKLLDQAIRMVKPGGLLVYSVCSLEPEEGPDQIRRLMLIDAPVDRLPVASDEIFGRSEMITAEGDVRTLPTHFPNDDPRLAGLDGFFAARLRRRV
ncbi:MAG TPA: RsmB/NOP family class I SAM-dependent RNA methyltransferase [Methylomirabilota bacterium]|nr:RsmB/NOP family class I SAM-dependent RNA methyltransferase [Methylomirabilota bacterium]